MCRQPWPAGCVTYGLQKAQGMAASGHNNQPTCMYCCLCTPWPLVLMPAQALACGMQPAVGPHAAQLLTATPAGQDAAAPGPSAVKVLYAWSRACGPHEAMADEGGRVGWRVRSVPHHFCPPLTHVCPQPQLCSVLWFFATPAMLLGTAPAACAGRVASDSEILSSVVQEMRSFSSQLAAKSMSSQASPTRQALTLVETAGGVASPAPSGDLQV